MKMSARAACWLALAATLAMGPANLRGQKDVGDPQKSESPIRWEDYSRLGATLCIYMGMRNLAGITERLQAGGLASGTPAAIIQDATTGRHRVLLGTVGTIAARAIEERFEAPAVILIGDVVADAEKLAWFDPVRTAAETRVR